MQSVKNSTLSAVRPLADTTTTTRQRNAPAQEEDRPTQNTGTGSKVTISQEARTRLNAENRSTAAAQQARATENTRKAEDTAEANAATRRKTEDIARFYGA